MWMALKYTPAALEAAWASVFAMYRTIFPNHYFSLALAPGLPIGNTSQPDANEKTETPAAVITAGLPYKPYFVLQEDALSSASATSFTCPEYNLVKSNAHEIVTGYQTTNPKYVGSLGEALNQGIAGGADFLELYTEDIKQSNDPALAAAANALAPPSSSPKTGGLPPPCKPNHACAAG